MDIGLILPGHTSIGEEVEDLRSAIKRAGCSPFEIYLDSAAVRMGSGSLSLHRVAGVEGYDMVDLKCAVLRSLGIIRDYEQFSHRIWTVRALELRGTRVSNCIFSWLRASDKLGALSQLSRKGIPVPDTVSSESFFAGYRAVGEFGEAVVKPLRGGKGLGVFKVDDPDVAMNVFSSFTNLSKPIYVQRYVEKKGGGDYRVIVVGGEVIGAEFRKGKGWKSNVALGGKARKAKPDGELSEIAVRSAEALELDYVGLDVANTKDGYMVMEANPTISWSSFKKVTRVNPARAIIRNLIGMCRR